MPQDYLDFLDARAAERRLAARFARPRWLLLHTLLFITTMTAAWAYMIAAWTWFYPPNYAFPALFGAAWSVLLVAHGLVHYARSSARREKRELAVEDAMRQFIAQHEDGAEQDSLDQDGLFSMHRRLETGLQRQGNWSLALMAFGVVNALSWVLASLNVGTSWPFQMTLPLAVAVIGGSGLLTHWLQQRQHEERNWFTRLPLRHAAAYAFGVLGLVLLGTFRMINGWDAEIVIRWWTLLLGLHLLVGEVVQPLLARFVPVADRAKRKPTVPMQLVMGDDGEVIDIGSGEEAAVRAQTL